TLSRRPSTAGGSSADPGVPPSPEPHPRAVRGGGPPPDEREEQAREPGGPPVRGRAVPRHRGDQRGVLRDGRVRVRGGGRAVQPRDGHDPARGRDRGATGVLPGTHRDRIAGPRNGRQRVTGAAGRVPPPSPASRTLEPSVPPSAAQLSGGAGCYPSRTAIP